MTSVISLFHEVLHRQLWPNHRENGWTNPQGLVVCLSVCNQLNVLWNCDGASLFSMELMIQMPLSHGFQGIWWCFLCNTWYSPKKNKIGSQNKVHFSENLSSAASFFGDSSSSSPSKSMGHGARSRGTGKINTWNEHCRYASPMFTWNIFRAALTPPSAGCVLFPLSIRGYFPTGADFQLDQIKLAYLLAPITCCHLKVSKYWVSWSPPWHVSKYFHRGKVVELDQIKHY